MVGIIIHNVLVWYNSEIWGKNPTKSAKTAISGIFPPFSARKNSFLKSDSAMFRVLLIRIFVQKIWKKLTIKSRENSKNRFFRHFGPKISFSKIGLRHIFGITILHQFAKFHVKIWSTAPDIQEIPFFRRKLAVPAIFRKFRLQN